MSNKKNLYLFAEITENYGHRLGTYIYNNKSNFDKSFVYPQAPICETHNYRHSFLSKQLISSYFNLDPKKNAEESKMVDELFNTYIDLTIKEINDASEENALIIIPAFFTIKSLELSVLKERLTEHFNLFFIFQYSNIFNTIENLFLLHSSGGRRPFFNDFNDFCTWLDTIELFDNIKNSIQSFQGGIFALDSDALDLMGENFLEKFLNILNYNSDLSHNDIKLFESRKVQYLKVHPLFKSFLKELDNRNLSNENKIKIHLFLDKFCRKILKINTDSFSFYEDLSIFNFNKILAISKFLEDIGIPFFKKTIPAVLKTESVKIFNDYYEL
jgi:hypothetical protein